MNGAAGTSEVASRLGTAMHDIRDAMKRVTEAGRNVLGEPIEIAGVGQYVSFMDPKATG